MSCKPKQTLQHSCSTGAFERETEHTAAIPNGADWPEEQWPGNIYSTTLEPQNCNQTSTKIDGISVAALWADQDIGSPKSVRIDKISPKHSQRHNQPNPGTSPWRLQQKDTLQT